MLLGLRHRHSMPRPGIVPFRQAIVLSSMTTDSMEARVGFDYPCNGFKITASLSGSTSSGMAHGGLPISVHQRNNYW